MKSALDIPVVRPKVRPAALRLTSVETRAMLASFDLACLLGGLVLSALTTGKITGQASPVFDLVWRAVWITGLWLFLAIVADIYDVRNAASAARTQRATLAAAVVCVLFKDSYSGTLSLYGVTAPYAAVAVLTIGVVRTGYSFIHKSWHFKERVLIFGAGSSGTTLASEVQSAPIGQRAYDLIGFIDDDPSKQGRTLQGVPVLGTSHEMARLLEEHQIDCLVMAVNSSPVLRAGVFPSMLSARESGIRIVSMPTLYELATRKVAVNHAGTNFGVYFPLENYQQPFVNDVIKRVGDIFAGLIGTIATLLLCPVVWLINQKLNKGPLFYRQDRVGKGGRTFPILKFRTMVDGAESDGVQWASEDDPRITRFGRVLRKTRIDELPQCVNILLGQMSLVGPRPERPEFVERLEETIPFYRARHAVKPGLTGWAQVMYHYGSSEEDAMVKLQYDLYYIKHRSLPLDLRIVGKTVTVVLTASGR